MPPSEVDAALAAAKRSAKEQQTQERIKLTGTEHPIVVDGRTVGTFGLGTYTGRKGEPAPVIVERMGGSTRIVSLLTAQAAAVALFGAPEPKSN